MRLRALAEDDQKKKKKKRNKQKKKKKLLGRFLKQGFEAALSCEWAEDGEERCVALETQDKVLRYEPRYETCRNIPGDRPRF